jgi:subtilisin
MRALRTRRTALAFALVAIAALLMLGQPGISSSGPPSDPGVVPGSWIVTVEQGQSPDGVAADHARDHGAQVRYVYRHALRGYAAQMSDAAAARVARDPRVRTVQADRVVEAFEQTLPTGIDRIDGELSTAAKINGVDERVDVDVAIIDTGIDIDHPDLNVVGGKNCSRGTSFDDGNGHGTHVAGTVGALDNDTGVVGVAPGARLWAVRVLDNSGSGSWSSVICGVDWVTARNADTDPTNDIEVANMSLGGSGSEGSCTDGGLRQAICKSVAEGVTYAVAAGNSAVDAQNYVPATYPEVITVSALADFDGKPGGLGAPTCRTDVDDTFANFSNYGADIDLIAPGVCILSTWKGGGYNTISGTSMASPHVAGAAALYKASNATKTPAQVLAALQGAGNLNWSAADDGDKTKETLLNVDAFDTAGTINTAPTASFTYECTNLACTFDASASSDADGTIASYEWNFGDGGTGSGVKPAYTYPAADTYTVALKVTDDKGATGTSSKTVTVTSPAGGTTEYSTSTSYVSSGGKTADKHLSVTIKVTDGTNAVSGATVVAVVSKNGAALPTVTGTTGSTGNVTFTFNNVGPGCYTTDVLSVNGAAPMSQSDPTSGCSKTT